jgi:hypothetical protein
LSVFVEYQSLWSALFSPNPSLRRSAEMTINGALLKMNVASRCPQTFSHTIRHLAFADKSIRTRRLGRLLPRIQMADENDNYHVGTGGTQFSQR